MSYLFLSCTEPIFIIGEVHLQNADVAGRFGGEEFLLILQNKTHEQALLIAEQCRQLIEQEAIQFDLNHTIYITASLGVALSNIGLSKEIVLRQADQALYLAKKQGRNQVRHFAEIDPPSP